MVYVDSTKKPSKKNAVIALVAILAVLGTLAGIGSGMLQYAFATVRCLQPPVAASDFMASNTYVLPGEDGYSPNVFDKYYCTEQDAKNAGFRHSHLTKSGILEEQNQQQTYEERRRFSPEKVDFKVYVPTGGEYTNGKLEISAMGTMGEDKQVFFSVKKDGYVITRAREGKAFSSYELCTGAQDSCEVIGTDFSGRSIKKQIANKDVVSYGMRINETFINFQGVDSEMTTPDIIALFNSLTEYKNE